MRCKRGLSTGAAVPGFFCLLFLLCFAGCASAPSGKNPDADTPGSMSGKTADGESATLTPSSIGGSSWAGTPLSVPSRDQIRKNDLDSMIMRSLENGSPASLKKVVELVNTDPRGMTDSNRIALSIAGELMKILYPLEPVTWPMPAIPETGAYIGAVKSARMGVYDYNTGGSDFLSRVLPSLVLVLSRSPGDYYADAETALLKAASQNSQSVLPPLFLALLYERQGKTALSEAQYEKAWQTDQSCYPAGVGYSRSLVRRGQSAQALTVARALLASYPSSIEMVKLCAESAFSGQNWESADSYILTVLKAEPDNTRYLLMRARILVERRDYLKANALLDAFATRNRNDKDYLLLRSRVVREWNKNIVGAASFLKDAHSLFPDDIEVMLASAEVCYLSGQAINGFGGRDFVTAVLAKDPSHAAALKLLVTDYLDAEDWDNALRFAVKLDSISQNDESEILLARATLGAGQVQNAVSIAAGLYASGSPSEEIIALYLQTLAASGNSTTLKSIVDTRLPGASSSLKSVLYYYESTIYQDPDQQLSSLRSSLLSDPRNQLSLFAMYEWYFARKDYRKAQYYLKQVIALDPANPSWGKLLSALEELLAR